VTSRNRKSGPNAPTAERQTPGEDTGDLGAGDFAAATLAHHSRKGSAGSSGGRSKKSAPQGLLSDEELSEVEELYDTGITAAQIVEIFTSRGVRFSEATFRKYVQQGLLPRSRRVGRKGKNRGSLGVYPPKVVKRINVIKSLMLDGYTIEEIQSQFLQFTDVIERLEEGLREVFDLFQADVESPRFDSKARKSLGREIADAEKCADELLTRINGLSQKLSQSHEDSYRSTGAAGSAEDLL
jgi:hypothetical protein